MKQWALDFEVGTLTNSLVNRLQTILLEKNDNSLIAYTLRDKIALTPQLAQSFKISPESYQ